MHLQRALLKPQDLLPRLSADLPGHAHHARVYSLYPGSPSAWCVELACETKLKLGCKAVDVTYEYRSHRSIRSDHLKARGQLVSSNASTCAAYAMNQMERIIASVFQFDMRLG